uniref:Uncharacterized protein n=1 Tax=Salmo trutta TaxID=8032 RepID=A0A674BS72_SALTR
MNLSYQGLSNSPCGPWYSWYSQELNLSYQGLSNSPCGPWYSWYSQEMNLSYQDLGDPFQQENFSRILRRLIRVERLQLINNSLTDLSSICLPRCRSLNLHRNHLTCVHQLPKLPAVEHLCLTENSISTLGGLGALGTSPLHSLTLRSNPVNYIQDYRAR